MNLTEKLPDRGVYEKDGKWYVRLDKKSIGAEVPKDIGHIMKAALQASRRTGRAGYEWVTTPYAKINCHRMILHATGLLYVDKKRLDDKAGPVPEDYNILLFPESQLKKFKSHIELGKYVKETIGDNLGVVQIGNRVGGALHSFFVKFDELGRAVCFEKKGYGPLPFHILPLRTVFLEYQEQFKEHIPLDWVCGTMASIRNDEALAKRIAASYPDNL